MPVATDAEAIHLLLIKRLTGSYSLLSLNIPTGGPGQSLREPKVIKGASLEKLESIMTFPPLEGSGSARCVYLDSNGSVKSVSFPAERAQNPLLTTLKGPTFIELRHLDLEGHGLFIGLKADGSSNILQAGHTGDLSALFDWSDAVEAPHFSGFIDRDGAVHVSRYTISKVLWVSHTPSRLGYTIHLPRSWPACRLGQCKPVRTPKREPSSARHSLSTPSIMVPYCMSRLR